MSQKIRIKFKAFDSSLLDIAIRDITTIARRSGAKIIGPIHLPNHIQKFCVNRSPHVDKKSRDQFEIRKHKRLIFITESNSQTMDSLMKLEISPGVKLDIKII